MIIFLIIRSIVFLLFLVFKGFRYFKKILFWGITIHLLSFQINSKSKWLLKQPIAEYMIKFWQNRIMPQLSFLCRFNKNGWLLAWFFFADYWLIKSGWNLWNHISFWTRNKLFIKRLEKIEAFTPYTFLIVFRGGREWC